MNKGLEALEYLDEHNLNWHDNPTKERVNTVKKYLKSIDILKLVLGLNATNRAIMRQAYETGWITEEQFNLLNEVLENDYKRY